MKGTCIELRTCMEMVSSDDEETWKSSSDEGCMYRAQDMYELRRFDLFTGNSIQNTSVSSHHHTWISSSCYRRHRPGNASDRARMRTFSFRLGDLDGNGFV